MKRTTTLIYCLLVSFASLAQTILAEHHFESPDIKQVVVEGVFCDISVQPGSSLIFDGIIKGNGSPGDYVIASIKTGTTVVFKVERKKEGNRGWSNIEAGKLTLTLPAHVELKVTNSSGDIDISDFTGELEASTSSGDIVLKNITSDCWLKTTSGDLRARNVTGNIAMSSTSGGQEYFEIRGNLETQATSGNIECDKVTGNVKAFATSGDLDFDGVEGAIEAGTTSGNITGDYVRITGDCRFKSTSGDIYFVFENEIGSLGFDLRATSGNLRVGNSRSGNRLYMDRGQYIIAGESTSGDQVYKN
ncbi:DUF4097 family beta strand repeat-containing protein [Marinoscillum sp.]|uniref:DUF4097 family beta strand repeat-containing protein n=1 Tax=Marinoscillum sp. TaxID=2024838 RepID=UPI003BAC25E3